MDYYIKNPGRLGEQPKRTIGDYIRSEGFLVPRSFDSLRGARQSQREILLRSEHPQDYSGISGLGESFLLEEKHRKFETIRDLTVSFFNQEDERGTDFSRNYKRFCELTGIVEDDFKAQSSFSIWEFVPGFNLRVVADSSITDRYHVIHLGNAYGIFENGKFIQEYLFGFPASLKDNMQKLIWTYEKIRHLDRFDSDHCPIMEFDVKGDDIYFLQYHRSRDFSPTNFVLDREPAGGEKEVLFVRGSTSNEDGENCKVVTRYYEGTDGRIQMGDEDGVYSTAFLDDIFNELNFRDRKIQVVITERGSLSNFMSYFLTHKGTSSLFKPELSLIYNPLDFIDRDVWSRYKEEKSCGRRCYAFEYYYALSEKRRRNIEIDLHVVSDGRRAFVSRV